MHLPLTQKFSRMENILVSTRTYRNVSYKLEKIDGQFPSAGGKENRGKLLLISFYFKFLAKRFSRNKIGRLEKYWVSQNKVFDFIDSLRERIAHYNVSFLRDYEVFP